MPVFDVPRYAPPTVEQLARSIVTDAALGYQQLVSRYVTGLFSIWQNQAGVDPASVFPNRMLSYQKHPYTPAQVLAALNTAAATAGVSTGELLARAAAVRALIEQTPGVLVFPHLPNLTFDAHGNASIAS